MVDVKIEVSGEMDSRTIKEDANQTPLNWSNLPSKIPTLKEIFIQIRKNLRSWTEFLNIHNFKTIPSLSRLQGRLIRNIGYFQSNYICVFIVLVVYCLITSPLILLVIIGVLFACHKIRQNQQPVTIFSKKFTTSQQCLLITLAASPIFYIVGVGAMMFWVLGASLFLITLHATFYNIDAIVTEDTEMFITETV